VRDITDRKRAEEALRHASAYTRSLIEASLDPLVTIGPDGKITDVNKATEEATGLLRGQLIGSDFSIYFTEPERARAGYEQVFREGMVRDYALELRRADGHVTPVLYNASLYRDESGEVIGVFAAARDITDRKRAEEALRHASAYTRSLIEASLDPLVTIGPDGKITDVNKATEEATGLLRGQLIGSDFSNYFTEPERARAGYEQVFREGMVRDYALELRRADGHVTPVLYNASLYRDESGEVVGVFAAARDVTDRKRAEEALRHASAYTRSLIEASLDPLVTIGPDGTITDVNKATEAATGLLRGQLIGSDFSNYFTEPERARAGYEQVFREGMVRDYALELRRADGHVTPVLYNASLYRDESGEVVGVFAAARDITDRKRAEEKLKKTARAFRAISECSQALVHAEEEAVLLHDVCRCIVDIGGYRLAWVGYAEEDEARSVRAVAQAGYEDGYLEAIRVTWADDALGRGPTGRAIRTGKTCLARDILHDPTYVPWREQALQRGYQSSLVAPLVIEEQVAGALSIYAAEPDAFDDEEVRLLTELSGDLAYGIKALRARQELKKYQDELQGLVETRTRELVKANELLVKEIDERKQAEAEIGTLNKTLNHHVAKLEAANKELEAFSYSVSHDLRAPLRAVDGFSLMLEEDYAGALDAEGKRLLDVIRAEAKKMGQLIDDLLSFSRLGRREMGTAPIDMSALARAVCAELALANPNRELQLIANQLPPAQGDEAMIRQVLVNLLANAVKFTRTRRTAVVEINGRVENEECVYSVKDNGVGFEMQYSHKLFGVFQRLHSIEEFEGTGVGLAIVQRIIHKHGGRVWAEGAAGQGATFYFTLPVTAGPYTDNREGINGQLE
jgi:PAS domain S-box-containing protein